jgi:cysteinyl-tRNA synthetase
MEWESPWGKGFPGWHIECSAMAMKYLGQTIDIHTGGIDHIDIHHNNEIAQSEAATGKKFVNYWIHFNFVLVDNQKMSKSLGNILTLDDIENSNLNPLSYKYLILTSHYKSEFNFTFKSLNSAEIAYNGIKQYLLSQQIIFTKENKINYRLDKDEIKFKILKIINNDFDTPGLISFLWNILRSDKNLEYKKLFIYEVDKLLGLNLSKDVKSFKIPPEIKKLIFKRENLRRTKNWQEADKIREFIFLKGFKIDDIKGGVVVKKNL